MKPEPMGVICSAVMSNCYATSWTYGEICCWSNCCGRVDPSRKAVIKARIAYHEQELKECKNFDLWFDDDPKLLASQKANLAADIVYHEKRLMDLHAGKLAKPYPVKRSLRK